MDRACAAPSACSTALHHLSFVHRLGEILRQHGPLRAPQFADLGVAIHAARGPGCLLAMTVETPDQILDGSVIEASVTLRQIGLRVIDRGEHEPKRRSPRAILRTYRGLEIGAQASANIRLLHGEAAHNVQRPQATARTSHYTVSPLECPARAFSAYRLAFFGADRSFLAIPDDPGHPGNR